MRVETRRSERRRKFLEKCIASLEWRTASARAGGATEADEAGAALEAIQAALTHSKETTTLRYIRRGRTRKIEQVAEARAAKRKAEGGENAG
jgi:hypothetical protein